VQACVASVQGLSTSVVRRLSVLVTKVGRRLQICTSTQQCLYLQCYSTAGQEMRRPPRVFSDSSGDGTRYVRIVTACCCAHAADIRIPCSDLFRLWRCWNPILVQQSGGACSVVTGPLRDEQAKLKKCLICSRSGPFSRSRSVFQNVGQEAIIVRPFVDVEVEVESEESSKLPRLS
jgi:hypothetical protein